MDPSVKILSSIGWHENRKLLSGCRLYNDSSRQNQVDRKKSRRFFESNKRKNVFLFSSTRSSMQHMQSLSVNRNAVRSKEKDRTSLKVFSVPFSYRCLRCFNYDLCQRCFFTGDHGSKHDGTHPIEEYCKQVRSFDSKRWKQENFSGFQVTPLEDLKAFVEFMKLKVGKKQVPRKERYLTIRRSKSLWAKEKTSVRRKIVFPFSSETTKTRAESSSNKNSQNSLSRSDQKSKNVKNRRFYWFRCFSHRFLFSGKRKIETKDAGENDRVKENRKNFFLECFSVFLSENSTPIEIHRDDLVTRSIPISYEEENCEAPLLAVKQRKIVVKSKKETVESEHYQSPLVEKQFEDEETPPPLPPKQRKIRQTSRSLVYDFIGTELKELHATLAKFEPNWNRAGNFLSLILIE